MALSGHQDLGICKAMAFLCMENISLKKVCTGSPGHGSVGKVFATQALGSEFDPQYPCKSLVQWYTPIIPVLRIDTP